MNSGAVQLLGLACMSYTPVITCIHQSINLFTVEQTNVYNIVIKMKLTNHDTFNWKGRDNCVPHNNSKEHSSALIVVNKDLSNTCGAWWLSGRARCLTSGGSQVRIPL